LDSASASDDVVDVVNENNTVFHTRERERERERERKRKERERREQRGEREKKSFF
jgi:hypothetical protein